MAPLTEPLYFCEMNLGSWLSLVWDAAARGTEPLTHPQRHKDTLGRVSECDKPLFTEKAEPQKESTSESLGKEFE